MINTTIPKSIRKTMPAQFRAVSHDEKHLPSPQSQRMDGDCAKDRD
jgi:hypothetical protein